MSTKNKKSHRKRRTAAQVATVHRMSLAEAAIEFGVPRQTLRRRLVALEIKVADGETYTILQIHRALAGSLGDAKLRVTEETARKLTLANDQREGRLIERAFMAERIQVAAGELNTFRAKSEAEHPTKFAAAGGDVPRCREIVGEIWDFVFSSVQSMAKHFEEKKG